VDGSDSRIRLEVDSSQLSQLAKVYTDGYAPVLLQFFWLWIVSLLQKITGLGSLRYILREIYSLLTKSTLFGCVTHTHSFKFGAALL
jgi:hypothetical protein